MICFVKDDELTQGSSGDATLHYNIKGPTTKTAAYLELKTGTPPNIGFLIRETFHVKREGRANYWKGTVNYTRRKAEEINSEEFSFSTTGGTANIKQALSTTSYKGDSVAAAVNPGGAINATQDGNVDGVDIVVPALEFQIKKTFAPGTLTLAFIRTLYAATGKTNSVAWRGFAIGEVLFLGAEGSNGDLEKEVYTYSFRGEANVTGLSFENNITGVAKKGHEYLWFSRESHVDSGSNVEVPRPITAHVAQVYDAVDFAALGLNG